MWWDRGGRNKQQEAIEALEKAVDRGGRNKQQEAIEALEKAVEALDSRQRLIKVEWESVLDKVNSVMGRLNARIRKSEAATAPETGDSEQGQPPAPVGIHGSHATLASMRGRRRGVLPG